MKLKLNRNLLAEMRLDVHRMPTSYDKRRLEYLLEHIDAQAEELSDWNTKVQKLEDEINDLGEQRDET